jgi:hypothetical protein
VGEQALATLGGWAQSEAPRLIKRWRKALNLANEERDAFKAVVTTAGAATGWDELGKAGRKRLLARPEWSAALALLRALASNGWVRRIDADEAALRAEGVAPEPLLTGADLIAAGLEPGPRFGQLLEQAYDAQLEGELADAEQARQWLNRWIQTSETGRA